MFVLLLSAGVSEIDIGPKHTDHKFEPVGLFQKREGLSADLGPVLLQLQLPPNTIILPVLLLLGLPLQAFIVDA